MIFALSISLSNRPQALGAVGKLSTNGNGWRRCNKSGNEHLYCNPYSIAILFSQKQLKLKVSRALFVLICHYREDNNNLLS